MTMVVVLFPFSTAKWARSWVVECVENQIGDNIRVFFVFF